MSRNNIGLTKLTLDELHDATKAFKELDESIRSTIATITEEEFRSRWYSSFFETPSPVLGTWVGSVAGSPNLPVHIVNSSGDVVCTIPPLFAAMGSTLTKVTSTTNINNNIAEAVARGKVRPTQRHEIMVGAMAPFVDRVKTDPKWVKEWVKTLKYFGVDIKDTIADKSLADGLMSTVDDLVETSNYDDFEDI